MRLDTVSLGQTKSHFWTTFHTGNSFATLKSLNQKKSFAISQPQNCAISLEARKEIK